jgi:glucosylceramidase
VYFTECSGAHGGDEPFASCFEGTLRWHMRNVIVHTTRNWAKTVIDGNLARPGRTTAAATRAPAWCRSAPAAR